MNNMHGQEERGPIDDAGGSDGISSLIHLAGRRPALPDEAAARVKAHVRAEWQRAVARRRRRTYLTVSLGAAAAALMLLVGARAWLTPPPAPAAPAAIAARVDNIVGNAWRRPGPDQRTRPAFALHPGDALAPGDEVVTEREARLSMRAATGHSIRLDGGTRIRLEPLHVIDLAAGAVYLDSGQARASTPVEIRTVYGLVEEKGTQFEVRLLDAGVRVRVREGSVVLRAGGGDTQVKAGNEAELDLRGEMRRRAVPAFGSAWEWTEGISPMMDLKGHTLREFLDWVSRERGLKLGFPSPQTAEEASRIILNGSIEGLTMDQALDTVLPTCRMDHRIEADMLILEPRRTGGDGG